MGSLLICKGVIHTIIRESEYRNVIEINSHSQSYMKNKNCPLSDISHEILSYFLAIYIVVIVLYNYVFAKEFCIGL